jgi:hypothetical protein
MEGDATYFSRRARDERAAATSAAHPTARRAHLDMADRYDELSSAIALREREIGIDIPALAGRG